MSDTFKVGDFIEVTAKPETTDFGTIRGTALDERGLTGLAAFDIQIGGGQMKQVLSFNLNYVDVKRLFAADVARNLEVNVDS